MDAREAVAQQLRNAVPAGGGGHINVRLVRCAAHTKCPSVGGGGEGLGAQKRANYTHAAPTAGPSSAARTAQTRRRHRLPCASAGTRPRSSCPAHSPSRGPEGGGGWPSRAHCPTARNPRARASSPPTHYLAPCARRQAATDAAGQCRFRPPAAGPVTQRSCCRRRSARAGAPPPHTHTRARASSTHRKHFVPRKCSAEVTFHDVRGRRRPQRAQPTVLPLQLLTGGTTPAVGRVRVRARVRAHAPRCSTRLLCQIVVVSVRQRSPGGPARRERRGGCPVRCVLRAGRPHGRRRRGRILTPPKRIPQQSL